jgi:hypothetical protein
MNTRALPELRENIESIVNEYGQERQRVLKRTAAGDRLAHAARPDLPDFGGMMQQLALTELTPLIQRSLPDLEQLLAELVELGDDDSVKAVCRVLPSPCDEYRESALRALGRMRNPKARKALSSHASWLSSAPKSDKDLARSLLKAT